MEVYKIKNERKCPAEKAGHSIKDTHEFYFKSDKSNLRYVIEATYHKNNFYAVKFYAKCHKDSKNRYSFQTCTDEPFKIMHTCTQILPKLLEISPGASFVAVGARSISNSRIEDTESTIRFKMYRRHIYQMVKGSLEFILVDIPENSGIALINIQDLAANYNPDTFGKDVLKRALQVKDVILECYDNIHIPD
ncbi:hypothetical protein HZQ94_05790 [Elizabethkingia anophelis]|uniref:hypothetical protein n=1 Tax=Elizabethkingia anophelis TaxID=1117645 RepID=UPI0021A7EDA1|nr:hypothetical protein [Elizabethkingia anophelis]MCT3680811.1 hypothetical protein [Elizabethkingia anophelis]